MWHAIPGQVIQNVLPKVLHALRHVRAQSCNMCGVGVGVSKGWDPAHYKSDDILSVVMSNEVIKNLLLAYQLFTLST